MNAILKPNVLRWARNKAGLSEDALAEKVGVQSSVVREWESTGSIPVTLVEKLAEKTKIAFGFLFLEEPPRPALPISDFRRVNDIHYSEPSDDLLDVIYSAQLKQNWYREYMISRGEQPISFVGKYSVNNPARETAHDIRQTLNIGPIISQISTTWEEAIRYTIEAAEEHGILVLRTGYAGRNKARTLSVDEFRGFAISDEYAPLVFINGVDAAAAQMFTLAHEIAHIWLGQTGVSNLAMTYSVGSHIETYCNSVAAEVLLPIEEIKTSWRGEINDANEIKRLSDKYKVSRIVVARRAKDAGFFTEEEYNDYYRMIAGAAKKSSGGSYYTSEKYQNSRRFSVAIIEEAIAGRTPQRDAMQYLGIKKEATLRKYAKSLQEGLEWPIS